jgi:hypothetical protein
MKIQDPECHPSYPLETQRRIIQNSWFSSEVLSPIAPHTNLFKAAQLSLNPSGAMARAWEVAAKAAIEHLARAEWEQSPGICPAFVLPHLSAPLRAIAAENSRTSSRILEQLAREEDGEVREKVARHPHTTRRVLEQLARDEVPDIAEIARQRLKTLGLVLLEDENLPEALRHLFAELPGAWETFLLQLAERGDESARSWVAAMPETPAGLLERLARDESNRVRSAVAENPNLPQSWVEQLFEDPVLRVSQAARHVLVMNGLPGKLLPLALGYHARTTQSPLIRFAALSHPQISTYLLGTFCASDVWLERYAIAQNPQTPLHVLKTLASDAKWIVRAAARANLTSQI